jgi:hypothetical protein
LKPGFGMPVKPIAWELIASQADAQPTKGDPPPLTNRLPRVGEGPSAAGHGVFQQNSAVRVRPGVDAFRSLMKVRVGRGFDPIHDRITGCSENPPTRGLRNPITAAIGQSKNRCSEYTDSRNTRRGPTRRRRVRCRRASRRPTLPEVGNWRLSAPKNKGPPSPPEASH